MRRDRTSWDGLQVLVCCCDGVGLARLGRNGRVRLVAGAGDDKALA